MRGVHRLPLLRKKLVPEHEAMKMGILPGNLLSVPSQKCAQCTVRHRAKYLVVLPGCCRLQHRIGQLFKWHRCMLGFDCCVWFGPPLQQHIPCTTQQQRDTVKRAPWTAKSYTVTVQCLEYLDFVHAVSGKVKTIHWGSSRRIWRENTTTSTKEKGTKQRPLHRS